MADKPERRLVKVALPGKLVGQMDGLILLSEVYSSRQDFIGDAIENLIADVEAERGFGIDSGASAVVPERLSSEATVESSIRTLPTDEDNAKSSVHPDIDHDTAVALMRIGPVDVSIAAVEETPSPVARHAEPTWGLHNRDWPTVWAAGKLGEASTAGPVSFEAWKPGLAKLAWQISAALGREWDLAGFPANPSKAESSEARFMEFFVGTAIGVGPLFSLGLAAAVDAEHLLLTADGADLLRRLKGLSPRVAQVVRSEWRMAFLRHLALWAPADLAMIAEVVRYIEGGASTRLELIDSIARNHPEWPSGTVTTNAAGYVARAREWGLLERKQVNHRYVGVAEGLNDLGQIVAEFSSQAPLLAQVSQGGEV